MMEDGRTSKRGTGREKNTQIKEHWENNKILHRHKKSIVLIELNIKTESTNILIKQLRVL